MDNELMNRYFIKGTHRDVPSGISNQTAMDVMGVSGMEPESGPADVLFHSVSHF